MTSSGGLATEYPWSPDACYLLGDDYPFLDVLVRGHRLKANTAVKLLERGEPAPDGAVWQRWDLEADLARGRRFAEVTLPLRVPKASTLRCYVIPTQLLDVSDVLAMLAEIESELGMAQAWDRQAKRSDRAWSRRERGVRTAPELLVALVETELRAARDLRRRPFQELGLHARRGVPLSENALVSHWAARRQQHLQAATTSVDEQRRHATRRNSEHRAQARNDMARDEIVRLARVAQELLAARLALTPFITPLELGTGVSPGPSFQRDHRLRRLLRAFAPPEAECVSPVEAPRSQYPPVFLNHLWELWGAVWLARQLRTLGFEGGITVRGSPVPLSCSWDLRKRDVLLQLDYEPNPVLLDPSALPPAHERTMPALEWAAKRQLLDEERPFLGMEQRCSPDYILRVTTPSQRLLVVGDGCLASPGHHGKRKANPKPQTVEHYRRTLGWAVDGRVVRCHPMGGFVLFPPPEEAWAPFEKLENAPDCTLLCPSPRHVTGASRRLENLLHALAPEVSWQSEPS